MKIAFCGASGVGKTTLCSALEHNLKLPTITNLTRKVQVELRGTKEGQQMILETYWDMFKGKDNYITDRTIFDICSYSSLLNIWKNEEIHELIKLWKATIGFPDILFYIPVEFDLPKDGRCPESWDRRKFSAIMVALLDKHFKDYVVLRGSVEERLMEVNNEICKSYPVTLPTSRSINTNPSIGGRWRVPMGD